MEFTDSDKIDKVTLRNFCYYRKYFWVHTFTEEYYKYGPSVFRPIDERVKFAHELYKNNILTYNMSKYNCEYFCRRCVFNTRELWVSKQTELVSKNLTIFFSKLATIMFANLFVKFGEQLEIEQNSRPNDIRYQVNDDSMTISTGTR
jgi:hypothetical protein